MVARENEEARKGWRTVGGETCNNEELSRVPRGPT